MKQCRWFWHLISYAFMFFFPCMQPLIMFLRCCLILLFLLFLQFFLIKLLIHPKKKNEKKKIASDFCYALLNLNKWVSFHFVSRLICCMMIHPEYNLNSFLWFKKLFLSGWLSISSAPHLLNLLQLKILVPNSHHCKLVSLFREIPSCIFLSMSWYCFYFKW